MGVSKSRQIDLPVYDSTNYDIELKSNINDLLIILYFSKKYKNTCIVISEEKILELINQHKHHDNVMDYYRDILRVRPDIFDIFKTCEKRFIFIPIIVYENSGLESHANILIYDTKTKELERFEPHGNKFRGKKDYADWNKLDFEIEYVFLNNGIEIKKYYKPLDFCPRLGFQSLERDDVIESDPAGFCKTWIIWYLELRLKNPDISREKVISGSIQKIKQDPTGFKSFIRNYSKFIRDIFSKEFPEKNIMLFDIIYNIENTKVLMIRTIDQIIPENIGKLVNLKFLMIEYNHNIISLPNSIGNLTNLTQLVISYNKNLLELPESIGNLTNLTRLLITYNRNLKTLPESIGNLEKLTELDLDENQLTSLPNSIGNLKELKRLNLRENQLTSLPDSIGNLENLNFLNIYNNPVYYDPEFKGKDIINIMKKRYQNLINI
jgi:hypothetical protein